MKTTYYLLLVSVFICSGLVSSYGQEARVVVVPGWDPAAGGTADENNNIFYDAVIADSTGRLENPNTIYELKRGHLYPQGNTLNNFGYHLQIRAGEGDGLLPEFIPGLRVDGTYGGDYLRTEDDLTLENIAFNAFRPDGGYLNRMVEIRAHKSRAIIDGCIFYGDRGAAIRMHADSLSVFIRNVTVGNTGHRKTTGGNGRLVDLRPQALYVDTLVIENSTIYNASDRIIRNMGSIVNYFYMDHLTAFNTKGWNGGVQLGHVRNATVKNSLFANVISMGHTEVRTNEQTQPEKHFAVISLDTVFDGQSIVVRNNNIYYDQLIKDVWEKYDTVSAPYPVSTTVETAVGAENVANIFFNEPLVFNQVCDPINAYVDALYTDPTAAEFPENWCVGGEDGGFFPDQIDAGYADTYDSYTAADGGFPVGNLNYFPAKKAEWESNPPTSVSSIDIDVNEFSIYPNPAREDITFEYTVIKSGYIKISICDISGKEKLVVVNQNQPQGKMQVRINPRQHLTPGIYLVNLQTAVDKTVKKIIIQ